MIIKQNILTILRIFLNLKKKKKKKKIEKLYTKQSSATAITEFLSKIDNRKKISNEHFNLCETETSLDEIIKSTYSETYNISPSNDDLTTEFHKHFSN